MKTASTGAGPIRRRFFLGLLDILPALVSDRPADLQALREAIEAVDEEILTQLRRRMEMVDRVVAGPAPWAASSPSWASAAST